MHHRLPTWRLRPTSIPAVGCALRRQAGALHARPSNVIRQTDSRHTGPVPDTPAPTTRADDGLIRRRSGAGSLTYLAKMLRSAAEDQGASKAELQDLAARAAFALQVLAEGAEHG